MGTRSQSGPAFLDGLHQRLSGIDSLRSEGVDTAIVRELVDQAFSDEELGIFCYNHFREVYDQFGTGMSKTAKIQRLIEYCDRHVQTETLLAHCREYNPDQFARFDERLRR